MTGSTLVKCLIAGVVAGLVGAGIWAGIGLALNMEIGYVAWGVGALVGFAVVVAAGETANALSGVVAALITVGAICGGKFMVAHTLLSDMEGDEFIISFIADDIMNERWDAGEEFEFPPGADLDQPDGPEDYPRDVWSEALASWNASTDQERDMWRTYAGQQLQAAGAPASVGEGFAMLWGPLDLLFVGLGLVTAFSVGARVNAD